MDWAWAGGVQARSGKTPKDLNMNWGRKAWQRERTVLFGPQWVSQVAGNTEGPKWVGREAETSLHKV